MRIFKVKPNVRDCAPIVCVMDDGRRVYCDENHSVLAMCVFFDLVWIFEGMYVKYDELLSDDPEYKLIKMALL